MANPSDLYGSVSAPFLGLHGTGKFHADQLPRNYREMVLFLDPNGTAPMYAMSSKAHKTVPTTSSLIQYYTQRNPEQGGLITEIYTDQALAVAYVSGGVAGDTLYVKMAAALAEGYASVGEFRPGHRVIFRYALDPTLDVYGRVTAVVSAGASSYVAVRLLEDDDNSTNGYYLGTANRLYIVGNANPEGGYPVRAVNYVETSVLQHTQIFKETIEVSRSALQNATQTTRTPADFLKQKRREKLLLYAQGIELSGLFSNYGYFTAPNGEQEWSQMGAIEFVKTYAPNNIDDYRYKTAYSGQSWEEGGETWVDDALANCFLYKARGSVTPQDRIGWTGLTGFRAINRLVKASGQVELKVGETKWGIRVAQWDTGVGTIYLQIHPMFNQNVSLRDSLFVTHPSLIEWVPLRGSDTKRHDITPVGFDGIMEEYIGEGCFVWKHAPMWAILHGLGSNSLV